MDNILFYFIVGFILLDLIIVVIVFIKKSKKKLSENDLNFINEKWSYILKSSSENPSRSIIDSDKLLDFVLLKMKFKGSTFEKMKSAENLFSNKKSLWSAHKLRNKIAHDFIDLSEKDVRFALNAYKVAFKDLKVI